MIDTVRRTQLHCVQTYDAAALLFPLDTNRETRDIQYRQQGQGSTLIYHDILLQYQPSS